MNPSAPNPPRRPHGQSVTEYIIIVALLAIATIGVIGFYGSNLRQLFGGSSESLAGKDRVANAGNHDQGDHHKALSTFGQNAGSEGGTGANVEGGSEGGSSNHVQ